MTQKIRAINIANNSISAFNFDTNTTETLNSVSVAEIVAVTANTVAQAVNTFVTLQTVEIADIPPTINTVFITDSSYNILNINAANSSGDYLIITGSNFQSGATVMVGSSNTALSTTLVDTFTLRSEIGPIDPGTYTVYVVNPNGGTAIKINALTTSSYPVWGTDSTLTNVGINNPFYIYLSANSDSSITYSNTTVLPTGTTLLSNGYFYGNISVSSATTYNFDVKATDAELQEQTRTFSLSAVSAILADILVIAGGAGGAGGSGSGAAGYGGCGGGAGGLLNSTEYLTLGSSYGITVGTGGEGSAKGFYPTYATSPGVSGNPSSFIGLSPGFSTISTTGGGGGQGTTGTAGSGGSGGGGPSAGTGIEGQGYPGSTPGPAGTGSGGGAGGAGSSGTSGGGAGYTWPQTSITYSIGGGGGNGGAGSGASSPNFGSGGGGGAGNQGAPSGGSPGGSGANGAVMISIPTPSYYGTLNHPNSPGVTASTPPAAPGQTVLTYTANGTFTVIDPDTLPPAYDISYLIVAGGGGGGPTHPQGYQGGGAGAGGLSTGTFTAFSGYDHTITIGSGGTAGTFGQNSSITSAGVSLNIPGGGQGGSRLTTAGPGGSGGGGGNSGGGSGLAIGSPGFGVAGTYGYPGASPSGGLGGLGGGGGAGSAGAVYTASPAGLGYTWPTTGSTYAGGGNWGCNPTPSSGGGGGGGGGTGAPPKNGGNGIVNTGGGGGGGGWISAPYVGAGGSGGSGVVILTVPTESYPGSAPGATVTTPPAAPGKTVLTYASSGTYTA